MQTVLITGGTGLIGNALTKALVKKNYRVIILSRNNDDYKNKTENVTYAHLDVEKQQIDDAAIAAADYIIHLAGANVAEKRWTEKRKKEIVDSRVNSGKLLMNAIKKSNHHIKAFVSASAIGWYGSDPTIPNPEPFTEVANHANDFLGNACYLWEQSVSPVENMHIRLVILRTGIVLSNKGGAFAQFKKPLKAGVAGVLGNGNQVISWIHIDDMVALYIAAIENDNFKGIYNAVAPAPVNNRILMKELAVTQNGKKYITIPVPAFMLKIGLGEMSAEILKSATVSAQKLQQQGFLYQYPIISSAIAALVHNE